MSFQLSCDCCRRDVPAPDCVIPGGWVRISRQSHGGSLVQYGEQPPIEICPLCFSDIEAFIKNLKKAKSGVTA